MNDIVIKAKAEFLQAKGRLLHVLGTTPDDRLNWSPSPTARTPLQVFVHASQAIGFLTSTLSGDTFAVPTPAEADKGFRESEREFTSREQAIELLETNSAKYVSWLEGSAGDCLDSMVVLPFGMGQAPMEFMLTMIPIHTMTHIAQIEYIQTIYGDQDWHM